MPELAPESSDAVCFEHATIKLWPIFRLVNANRNVSKSQQVVGRCERGPGRPDEMEDEPPSYGCFAGRDNAEGAEVALL